MRLKRYDSMLWLLCGAFALVGGRPALGAEILAFDDVAAVASNGPIPGTNGIPEITGVGTCGSTRSYLAELIDTPPQQVKVIDHWADVVAGREMMMSGVVRGVSLGGTDLPLDHPFSSDLNFDVELDEPYRSLSKQVGAGSDPDGGNGFLHVELELAQLPHDPALVIHGPASGQPWDVLSSPPPEGTLNANAHTGLLQDYVPQVGDRVVVMGRWILDCGHSNFSTEIHPLTFMAFGRVEGSKTVVHVVGNPYRSTQRYSLAPGGADANAVNAAGRAGSPFPTYLVQKILELVLQSGDRLESSVLIEATRPRPSEWKVCAPAASAGRRVHIRSSFVRRPGTRVRVRPAKDEQGVYRCARVVTQASNGYSAMVPTQRQCTLPWSWLNTQAAYEGGFEPGFDLRPFVKDAIDQAVPAGAISQSQIDAAKAAIDVDPSAVCFDPLAAPLPEPVPSTGRRWRKLVVRGDQPFPFYGRVEVNMGD